MRIARSNKPQIPLTLQRRMVHSPTRQFSAVTAINSDSPFSPNVASVSQALDMACRKFGKRAAFECKKTAISFSQLQQLANRFAGFLQNDLGIRKGDRVAIMLPNLLQFPVAFMAAQKIGAICVAINPQYTAPEMQKQLKDSGAKAIVLLDLFLGRLETIFSQTDLQHVVATQVGDLFPAPKRWITQWMVKRKQAIPHTQLNTIAFRSGIKNTRPATPVELSSDDIAVLQYTGGTTGISKGAMLTHGNLLSNMRQMHAVMGVHVRDGQDEVLNVLPLYHSFSLTVNFLTLACKGAINHLDPKPTSASMIAAFAQHPGISIFAAVNTQFNDLLNNPLFVPPRNLRIAIAGGTALQSAVQERWQSVVGVPINQGYGLTEASPLVAVNILRQKDRPGSIGRPVPDTEVKVVDEAGNFLPHGEAGVLLVRGPQVMKGYWKKADETAAVINSRGFLNTGDIAKIDHDGFLYIVDRKKDLIIVDGHNVYPNEIEDVFAQHPEVKEVAAIGVTAGGSGERPKVFIVPKDASIIGDKEKTKELKQKLMAHAQAHLVPYALPRYYEFRADLPKSNVGKILRRQLRDEATPES